MDQSARTDSERVKGLQTANRQQWRKPERKAFQEKEIREKFKRAARNPRRDQNWGCTAKPASVTHQKSSSADSIHHHKPLCEHDLSGLDLWLVWCASILRQSITIISSTQFCDLEGINFAEFMSTFSVHDPFFSLPDAADSGAAQTVFISCY